MSSEDPSKAEPQCHGWGWHCGFGMSTLSAPDPHVGSAVRGLDQEPSDGTMRHLSGFI